MQVCAVSRWIFNRVNGDYNTIEIKKIIKIFSTMTVQVYYYFSMTKLDVCIYYAVVYKFIILPYCSF